MLIISPTAQISPLADVEDSVAGSRIVVEDGVMIDSFVKIKPVGGTGDVVIGANSVVNSGTVIYSGNGVRIGKNVLIASNCSLAPVNHQYAAREASIRSQRFRPSKGGIVIADDVWVGAGTVMLDGAVVGTGAVIGAASLVRGQLEEYGVYAGNPLRKIGVRQ